jgi:uracil-DNA glycosylase family 4
LNFSNPGTVEPLAEGYSTKFIPTIAYSQRNLDMALLIVGEGPGREEDEKGEPFVGKSGRLLRGAYIDHWRFQDHADVYLTNLVRCRPPDNRTPRPAEIKKHRPFLGADIRELSGQYGSVCVLCVGASSCKAFGMKSLSAAFKQQGAEVLFGNVKVRFFATWHPAFVLRDPSVGTSLESHLACLMRHLRGKDHAIVDGGNANWLVAPACVLHKGVVCLDIETYGCISGVEQSQFHPAKAVQWDNVRPSSAIVSCALSWDTGSAFYNLELQQHRRALCSVLRQVQNEQCVLLLQNATFDLTFLRAFLPTCRPYLEPPLRLADLMVSSYLVDEARPERSLKALAPLLMGQQGLYKDEWRSLNFTGPDDPELACYNVADTERTLECHRICRDSYPRMYGVGTQKGSAYSDRWYSDLLHLVTWMSECGVAMDTTALAALDRHLSVRKVHIERLAKSILNLTLEGKGSDKSKRGVVSTAVESLPASETIAERIVLTKTGKMPYDEETRNLLVPELDSSNPIGRRIRRQLRTIGMHQTVSKLQSTYTGPILRGRKRGSTWDNSPRVIDGRVYPTWYPVPREFGANESGGTKQGRLSAKSPSVPTFPPPLKKLIQVDAWVDYSGIELRTAALMSGDPVMMSELSGTDGDLHARTARLIFGDDIVNHPQFHAVYRQAGKKTNFLMLYLGGAEKLRHTLLTEVGLDYPIEKCYAAIDGFWSTYSVLRAFIDSAVAFVRKRGFYELPLTGQSRLFARANPPINEVASFLFQPIAANITLSAQYHLWATAKRENVAMTCPVNIYDAIGIVLHPQERRRYGMKRASKLMADILPSPPYYRDLCTHLGRTLPLAYEVKNG